MELASAGATTPRRCSPSVTYHPPLRSVSPCFARALGTPRSSSSTTDTSIPPTSRNAHRMHRATHGAGRARTDDLLDAIEALSQLSYSP